MSQPDKVKSLLRDMESYFGTAREDDGLTAAQTSPILKPDSAKAPMLRLHDYKRESKKRVIAEALLERQHGRCASSNPEGGECGGVFFEIDHIKPIEEGGSDTWENMRLLCEHHHRIKTNQDRARIRHSADVYVNKSGVSFDGAGLSPKSVSLENDKHENYVARFDKAAPAYFLKLEWDGGEGPVVSIRTFRRAMIGALTYTDEAGRTHKPSQVTLDRYIDADIYPDNPAGRFEYAQTSANEDGIRWVAKKPVAKLRQEMGIV